MRPGERITLIKRIASALSRGDNWADVGLTLGQFAISYDDRWEGGLYEMVLDAAQSAPDEALLELHGYLYPDAQTFRTGAPGSAGGPWDPDSFRLFVTHTHANREFAGRLRTVLKHVAVDAFVAHDTIEPTREWQDEIESALNTCDALLALLTDDFVNSKWCDQEIGFCLARAVLIIPLRMSADPHGFIGKYQGLTQTPGEHAYSLAPRVFDLLAQHDLTRARMVRPVVQRYVRSRSFQNTRDTYPLLTAIPKVEWTDQLVRDVLNAAETNTQVQHANLDGRTPIPAALEEHLASLGVLPTASSADDEIPF